MSHRILVPLADGFEEIEAIVPVDVFRRAGFDVVVAGLQDGPIRATRGTVHLAERPIRELWAEEFDLIYLPGGQPGANHLAACAELAERLGEQERAGGWLAAICAAPLVLDRAGLLAGKNFVCHPGAAAEITSGARQDQAVVVDGKLITGRAAGAAMELALTVVRELAGWGRVEEVNQGLICDEELLAKVGLNTFRF